LEAAPFSETEFDWTATLNRHITSLESDIRKGKTALESLNGTQ